MNFSNILNLIDKTKATSILLLCHPNADPDALGSAYAFQSLLKKLRTNLSIIIGADQGISRLSKHFMTYVPITCELIPDMSNVDIIILIDTNTTQQLGNLTTDQTRTPIIVVDHHAIHPKTKLTATLCVIDDSSPSTCEIIYGFYKEMNIKPDLNAASALFLGIAFDTRHFILGNSSTFKTISELCEIGVDPQKALTSLSISMSFSEKIARLKASGRSRIITINKWIIVVSEVSSYHASAARALIDLGAHMAAVAGKKGEIIDMSFRCTNKFNKDTGIHLGKDIAQPLGEYLHGTGGGHSLAAGLNGEGKVEKGFEKCLVLIRKILEKPL